MKIRGIENGKFNAGLLTRPLNPRIELEPECVIASSLTKVFHLGPVRTTRDFVCLLKKLVNVKPFSMRTICLSHQNFRKCQTSKIPSTSFGGLQFSAGREIHRLEARGLN